MTPHPHLPHLPGAVLRALANHPHRDAAHVVVDYAPSPSTVTAGSTTTPTARATVRPVMSSATSAPPPTASTPSTPSTHFRTASPTAPSSPPPPRPA